MFLESGPPALELGRWGFSCNRPRLPLRKLWDDPPLMVQHGSTWLAATDGSGGEDNKDSRLTKVGWGLVVSLPEGLCPMLTAYGGLSTEPTYVDGQTVPLAELAAACWLAEHTEGNLEI